MFGSSVRSVFEQEDRKRKFWRSIQSKFILILLFLLIPTILIQGYVVLDRFQTRRTDEIQSNLELARAVSKGFEAFVQNVSNQELTIGIAITTEPMTSADITRNLLKSVSGNEAVRDFSWADPQGKLLHSSNPAMVGATHLDRTYFQEIVRGRETAVSRLVLAKTTGKPVYAIARGLRDASGALLGVVIATIVPEKLDSVISVERGAGGSISIVDSTGMLVYRYPSIEVSWEERNRINEVPLWREALNGKEVVGSVKSLEGKKRIVALTPIASIGWATGAGRTEDVAMASLESSLLPQMLLFLSITIIAFSLAFVFSRRISSSVTQLRNHALALGRGESQNLAIARGCTEIEDLADAFNQMSEEMRSREEEHYLADASLRESEEYFRLVFDKAPIGATIIGLDFRFLRVNETFCEIIGYTREELNSLKFTDLTHPEDRDWNIQIVQEAIRGEAPSFHLEKRYFRKNGGTTWVRVSGRVIRDQTGQPLYIVSMTEDITERKEMETALRKAHDELENRVRERTAELVNANEGLQDALAKIKTLSGLLPICAHCKKIRNDEGYWQQIETYIHQHSGTQFSHGVCPDCLKKHYAEFLGGRLGKYLEKRDDK